MQDLAGAAVCNMVCDGQRVGVRHAPWLVSTSSQAPYPLHLAAGMECSDLLFPFYTIRAALLLRAVAQYSPRVQHEHRLPQPRGNG